MSPRDYVTAVQHSALERALVDGDDARRYFALAGTLEAVDSEPPNGTRDAGVPSSSGVDADCRSAGLLSAAMLSLAVLPQLVDSHPSTATTRTVDPWTADPWTADPWTAGRDPTQSAVTRGAQLAVRWFDVSPEQVASRAGLPEAALTTSVE